MEYSSKQVLRIVMRAFVVLVVFGTCVGILLWILGLLYPFLFFHPDWERGGSPVYLEPEYDLSDREPVGSLVIGRGMRLTTYLPEDHEQAPIVQLVREDGSCLWTMIAMPSDSAGNYADGARCVNLIRFDRIQGLADGVIGVFGFVDWRMGLEHTWWEIGPNGELAGYWYSL